MKIRKAKVSDMGKIAEMYGEGYGESPYNEK